MAATRDRSRRARNTGRALSAFAILFLTLDGVMKIALPAPVVESFVRMGIPILVSRSGFTAWGVELAREAGLTLIGRCKGKRFVALSGEERIVFDADLTYVQEESAKHWRKNSAEAMAMWDFSTSV